MIHYLLKRIPSLIVVLVATSVIAFFLPRFAPGNAATVLAGPDATAETIASVQQELGLDRPILVQYFDWIAGVLRGDFGTSYISRRPVSDLILNALGSTVELAIAAGIMSIAIGIGLGYLGGWLRSRVGRTVVDLTNTLLLSVPAFLIGLLLIIWLGLKVGILPASGEVPFRDSPIESVRYVVLPAFALATAQIPIIARMLQTSMLTNAKEPYVELAYAKGNSRTQVTTRHVLPTSLSAAVTVASLRVGGLLGGTVVVETIFGRQGLGKLAVNAANGRDFQVLQIVVLGAVVLAVISQLFTEIFISLRDPRVRLEG